MISKNITSVLIAVVAVIIFVACKEQNSAEASQEQETEARSAYKEAPMIDPDEFEKGMKKSKAALIDVRFPAEYEQGHIEGAINMNFFDPNFKSQLLTLDKDKKYYLYCKNDTRSERAAEFLLQNDYPEVYVLKGGYEAWIADGKK